MNTYTRVISAKMKNSLYKNFIIITSYTHKPPNTTTIHMHLEKNKTTAYGYTNE